MEKQNILKGAETTKNLRRYRSTDELIFRKEKNNVENMDDQEKGGDQDEGPTVASEVPFSELCGLLEKISKTQGNDKKKRILKDFIDKWREYHDKLHKGKKDLVCSVIETMSGQFIVEI